MRSAVIRADHRYPAVLLAEQPGHERIVRPGPLVLGSAPLNTPTPTTDTDRTVSRRSEPSSCTTLTGEQPDPWDLLQPGLPDHYGPLSWRLEVSLSPSGWLLPLHSRSASTDRAEPTLRAPPLLFRRRPPQSNCPPATVPERVCLPW